MHIYPYDAYNPNDSTANWTPGRGRKDPMK